MGSLLGACVGLGFGGRDGPLLWLVDFSAVAVGAGSIADPAATFYRASGGGSVQTSATTIVTAGLTNDVPRYGYDGTRRGLVIECARTNLVLRNRDLANAAFSGATGTFTYDTVNGPDGTLVADRLEVPSAALGRYQGITIVASSHSALSCWERGLVGGESSLLSMANGAVNQALCTAVLTLTTAWTRYVATGTMPGPETTVYAMPATGGALSTPVRAAGARDAIVDLLQVEPGARYPTEAIPTVAATVTRAGERLSVAAAKIVSSSRVEVEIDLYAKGAATEYASDGAHVYLLYTDASNYIRIDTATRRLEVTVAGATWSPVTALTWARGDRVTFRVAAGGGALVSRASYSVNGGAYTDLGTTAAQGTWPATATDICSAATASQLSCWLASARAYKPGRMP